MPQSHRDRAYRLAAGLAAAAAVGLLAYPPRSQAVSSAGWHAPAGVPSLEEMASTGLTDFEAKVHVVESDQAALGKISRDFGMAYRLKELTMRFKSPDKLRMDGAIGQLIYNGPERSFKVPALHLARRDELGNSPGKRYSLMDIGLLTRASLKGTEARYVRDETLDGVPTHVFDFTYRGDDTARYVVWLDPRTHTLPKREWYDGAGKLRATFVYQSPREVRPGLWFPTRVEIRNADHTVAAITAYSDLKVNLGLDDALFEIS